MLKGLLRIYEGVRTWAERFYPGWKSWAFFSLILSFLFLALSGFFFFLFTRRGLFGLPLLLHVVVGGIFAVCLSMMVVWRARDYSMEAEQPVLLKALFWAFVVSGLCLIVTSLSSMISFLPMQFQIGMIKWHRFSAVMTLVSASIFFQYSLNREE